MVVCFAFLCGWSIKTDNLLVPYIGNVLSFASSYLIAKWLDADPMPEYFKPFTFYSLIALISAVVLIMHTVIVLVCQMKKRPVDQ